MAEVVQTDSCSVRDRDAGGGEGLQVNDEFSDISSDISIVTVVRFRAVIYNNHNTQLIKYRHILLHYTSCGEYCVYCSPRLWHHIGFVNK